MGVDQEIEAIVTRRLKEFELQLVERYGLTLIGEVETEESAHPGESENTSDNKENVTANMSEKTKKPKKATKKNSKKVKVDKDPPKPESGNDNTESGLETEALDTICPIGKFKDKTLREVWISEGGEQAVKVFAKSQHAIAGMAAVVVAYFGDVVE